MSASPDAVRSGTAWSPITRERTTPLDKVTVHDWPLLLGGNVRNPFRHRLDTATVSRAGWGEACAATGMTSAIPGSPWQSCGWLGAGSSPWPLVTGAEPGSACCRR